MDLRLIIIRLDKFAARALVYGPATSVKHVVKFGQAFELMFGNAGGCSFQYRVFNNYCAFTRPKIGLTIVILNLIRICFREATVLHARKSGVCMMLVLNSTEVWNIQGSSFVSKILNFWQICYSVNKSAFVNDLVSDILSCGGAGCGNVADLTICTVFCGNLRLTYVEI